MVVDTRRARSRNEATSGDGPVLYWMQRDQRVDDNWALLYASEQARLRSVPLLVIFNLVSVFGNATLRQYDFMIAGLREVEASLRVLKIPFYILRGDPAETVPKFVAQHVVGEVVTDFNPLRFADEWRTQVASLISVRMTEVDAHNIVPCWYASPKEEFAAYTFRPKVVRLLPEFLTNFPKLEAAMPSAVLPPEIDFTRLLSTVKIDRSVLAVTWLLPGSLAAQKQLHKFCDHRLERYDQDRNDPNKEGQSHLSPYLHFGQLSAQRVALTVKKTLVPIAAREAYLEELIVRKELADNYCYYNHNYDQVEGAHAWAKKTIAARKGDAREYVYTLAVLDEAHTHDDLWNAMQKQLVSLGKLHGWCRMYWAKKILEWTPDTQTAINYALYLNDRYELDGSDPNGVAGVMWSIAGVHDRAWSERPIFGKIRYMNYAGAKRKFTIKTYIARHGEGATLFHE